jgi:predicted small metal-binding protein
MEIKPLQLNMETIMFFGWSIGCLYRIVKMESKIESSIEEVNNRLKLHIEESHGARTMMEFKIEGMGDRMKEIITCLNAGGK